MIHKLIKQCILGSTLLFLPLNSYATTSKILLIVNKNPITERDLQQRIKLLTFGSGGKFTDVTEAQRAEILETLVHESLQIQEAQKAKIDVKESDITASIVDIAKDNNMTKDQFLDMLKTNGIDKDTLFNRLKAQMYWSRYIRQRFSPLIHVSDKEAETLLKKMDAEKGSKEYQVSEIFFPVNDLQQDDATQKNAHEWVDKIRKGMKFEGVAENISGGSLKTKETPWRPLSAFDASISSRLSDLKIGQVSDPIKVSGGYKIIQLKDIRHAGKVSEDDTQVTMVQTLVPVSAQPTEEEMAKYGPIVDDLVSTKGCQAFSSKSSSHGLDSQEHKDVRLGQLPDPLKGMAKGTPIGKSFQPIMTPDGLILTMVCQRKEAKPIIVTKDDISTNLEQQKFGTRAERELQRIKTIAYIEVKDESVRKMLKL